MRRSNSVSSYKKYIAEGRGTGNYSHYKPWLRTQDVFSKAPRFRVSLLRFHREFHLLSNGERKALLEFDWDPTVIEIREQFPLKPEETIKICQQLGIKHPSFGGNDTVMTTDFLLTRQTERGVLYEAYQIKHDRSDLEDPRTVEKITVEKRYWNQDDIDYSIILSSEIHPIFIENLERLRRWRNTEIDKQSLKKIYAFAKWGLRRMRGSDLLITENFPSESLVVPEYQWKIGVYESVLILLSKQIWIGPIRQWPIEQIQLQELRERIGNAR